MFVASSKTVIGMRLPLATVAVAFGCSGTANCKSRPVELLGEAARVTWLATDELCVSPRTRALVQKVSGKNSRGLPSSCAGIGCGETQDYAAWIELKKGALDRELRQLVLHEDAVVRGLFAPALGRRDPQSVDVLYPLLADPTVLTRTVGCFATHVETLAVVLRQIQRGSKAVALPLLVRAAGDRRLRPRVRDRVCTALLHSYGVIAAPCR